MMDLGSNSDNDGTASNDLSGLARRCVEECTRLASISEGHDRDHIRREIKETAKQLYELASDPDDVVTHDLYWKIHDINAFAYVSRYNVAAAVPVDGSISYQDLATKTGTGSMHLRRCLRQLMTIHVFRESSPNQVAHTAASARLLVNGVKLYNDYLCRETFKLAAYQLDAIDQWGHDAEDPTHTANNFLNKTDKSLFDYYATIPGKTKSFFELMAFVSESGAQGNEHLLSGYPWAELGKCTLVDVGGSTGHCSAAIAKLNQAMDVTVQDLPQVIDQAQGPAGVIPSELAPRIRFMPHNFLEPQPIQGADVYFLRMILHDWPDSICETILRHITGAMRHKKGAKLIVMDTILPMPGEWPSLEERMVRTADLQMGLLFNARERDLDEWKALFHRADVGLETLNVVQPKGSQMGIMELQLRG
ncbi:O-methyltransferase [Elsinoe ampelina]|uniref:O-methyltransferase n=1 Tax=Elsinoe ampelina TaxID=302913 RepID=A0A6A6G0G0_9PEZI|nr:O-methyltransferase [Elsinoe ampelina]